jgi:tetratricopeptide (TPR) repeat protein
MWKAIAYVSSGVTLIAFISAVVAWVYRNQILKTERIIRLAPEDARAGLVERALEFFSVDTSGLTRKQKYDLAIKQIHARAARFRTTATVVVIITFLAAGVTTFAIWRETVRAVSPQKDDDKSDEIRTLEATMIANYQQGDFGNAERVADTVLKLDPNHKRALTVKGAIAYQSEDYQTTVKYYTQALNVDPKNPVLISNLAWVYIDVGGYARAIELLKSIEDGKTDWRRGIGRAYLYAGDYKEALEYLETVPTNYQHGEARVEEAAANMGLSKDELDPKRRATLVSRAKAKLQEGINHDPEYWKGILSGKRKDPKIPYKIPLELLKPIIPTLS